MPGVDQLIEFLLAKIALRGVTGIRKYELVPLIRRFYESNDELKNGLNEGVGPDAHALVDENLCNVVWNWLCDHDETILEFHGISERPKPTARLGILDSQTSNETSRKHTPIDGTDQFRGTSNTATLSVADDADQSSQQRNDENYHRAAHQSQPEDEEVWLLATEDRMWRALTGHEKDLTKVPFTAFQLISIIASREEEGISQVELVVESQQDKRSVPKRTDVLARDGYIEKRSVQLRGLRTSWCTLKAFSKPQSWTAEEEMQKVSQGDASEILTDDKTILLDKFFDFVMQIVKEKGVIALEELRATFTVGRWQTRAILTHVSRMARLGCVKQVKARGMVGDEETIMVRSIQFIRDATPLDRELFLRPWRTTEINKLDSAQLEPEEDDILDDRINSASLLATECGGGNNYMNDMAPSKNAENTDWRIERSLRHLLFDVIDEAGIEGISTIDIKNRFGRYYGRPIDQMLTILTDHWQITQSKQLAHLAIVRDTDVRARATYYRYRTYENFKKAIETGKSSLDLVEVLDGSECEQNGTHGSGVTLDKWGFDSILEGGALRRNGTSTHVEARQAYKRKRPSYTPANDEMIRHLLKPPRLNPITGEVKSRTTINRVNSQVREKKGSSKSRPQTKEANRRTKGWHDFKQRAKRMAEQAANLENNVQESVAEGDGYPAKRRRVDIIANDGHVSAFPDQPTEDLFSSSTTALPPDTSITSTGSSLKRPMTRTEVEPALKRLKTSNVNPQDPNEILESAHVASTSIGNTEKLYEEFLEMKRPGVYIDPPARMENRLGRPKGKSKLVVFKSQRLNEFSWFLDESNGDVRKDVNDSQRAETPEVIDLPITYSHDTGDAPSTPLNSLPASSVISSTKNPRSKKVVRIVTPTASRKSSMIGDQDNTQPLKLTRQSPSDRRRKRQPQVKAGLRLTEGSSVNKRSERILDIVRAAGGLWSDFKEMYIALQTALQKEVPPLSIDPQTVSRTMQNMVKTGRLKKMTFGMRGKNGIATTKNLHVLPEMSADSDRIRTLQENVIKAHPNSYFPPGIEVDPKLKYRRDEIRYRDFPEDESLSVNRANIPLYVLGRDRNRDDPDPRQQLENSPHRKRHMDALERQHLRELAEIQRLEEDITEKQATMQSSWSLESSLSVPKALAPTKSSAWKTNMILDQQTWQEVETDKAAKEARHDNDLERELQRLEEIEIAQASKEQLALQDQIQLTRYNHDPDGIPADMEVEVSQGSLHAITKEPKAKAQISRSNEQKGNPTELTFGEMSSRLSSSIHHQRFATPRQIFHSASGTFGTLFSSAILTCRILPSIRPQIDAYRDFEEKNPHSLQELLAQQAKNDDQRQIPNLERGRGVFDDLDQIQAWEQDQSHLFTSDRELTQARFITVGIPVEIASQIERDRAKNPYRSRPAASRLSSGVSRPIKRLKSAKTAPAPTAPIASRDPHPSAARIQSTKLTASDIDRLCLIVVVVRTLAGGHDCSINWDVVRKIFNPDLEKNFLESQWESISLKKGSLIKTLQEKFWTLFLKAYDAYEVPQIDLDNTESYDWKAAMKWAEENITSTDKSPSPTPPARTTQVNNLNDLDDSIEVKPIWQYPYKPPLDPLSKSVTMLSKEEHINRLSFTVPIPIPQSPVTNTDTPLSLAKSLVRASIMTPARQYDAEVASQKLNFSDELLQSAVAELKTSKTINVYKTGRVVPGRNFRMTSHFNSALNRHSLGIPFLKRATKYKLDLDHAFDILGFAQVDSNTPNHEVFTALDLIASGQVCIKAELPPISTSPHVPAEPPAGPATILSVWGFTYQGYKTAQIAPEKFRFELTLAPTSLYKPGLPMSTSFAEAIAATPPPGPDFPCEGIDTPMRKIPLWYDINGSFLPQIWENIASSVLSILVLREGADETAIAKVLFAMALELWEVRILLEWLEEVGYAKKGERGWWKAVEGWWSIFGAWSDADAARSTNTLTGGRGVGEIGPSDGDVVEDDDDAEAEAGAQDDLEAVNDI